jgi:hypothetical protein
MALVKKLERLALDRPFVHAEVDCTYTVFESDGKRYLQLDTYGSPTRKIPGKKSQSLQLGPTAITQLKDLLKAQF